MSKFEVLSINPETKLLERMSYKTRVAAEAQQQRAIDQGRIMIEITDTPEQHLEWTERARKAITELEGQTPNCGKSGARGGTLGIYLPGCFSFEQISASTFAAIIEVVLNCEIGVFYAKGSTLH